jgi:hypothetical protein
MPKKTRKAKKSKPKKTKKIAHKPVKKSTRKPARKKTVKKKAARKTAKPARKPTATKALMTVKPALPPMKLKSALGGPAVPIVTEQRVGIVVHYYSHLSVAIIKLDQGSLQVGNSIHIKGHTTHLEQRVESMQIEHQSIQRAEVGQEFGLQVSDHVREHDVVYKVLG